MEYEFNDIEGQHNRVELDVICAKEGIRPYGIRARIFRNGGLIESAEAKDRFMTLIEAETVLKMLCEFKVTPCTLCDVI